MKYLILHGEGFADVPSPALGGKTPLQAAVTPNLDRLASAGEMGLATLPPDSPVATSDLTALSLLGYDPRKAYPGPAPFEAIGLGIAVGEQDVVYRCNMVTFRAGAGKGARPEIKKLGPTIVLEAASAEGLEDEEARELIEAINEQLGSETIQFYPGVGSRHFMVWVGGKARATCVDPNDLVGKSVSDHLPSGDGSDILRKLMDAALVILSTHPVNDQRAEAGLKPANGVWLWGQGRAPHLEPLTETRHLTGVVVSGSEGHRGVAVCAGLEAADIDSSAPGEVDLRRHGEAALRELTKKDLVYLHVGMPPEIIEADDAKAKVRRLEEFDTHVVGPLLSGAARLGRHRILVLCDGCAGGAHAPARLTWPYALYEGPVSGPGPGRHFCEAEAEAGQVGARDATKLIAHLIPRS
ncbi:cofactor-independent phosphoglycerate mutase [Candidatus Nitrospira bockiana]